MRLLVPGAIHSLTGPFCSLGLQTGGMMHDACHNNITVDRKFNYWMSVLFGTVGFGTPASWWKVLTAYP